MKNNLDINWQEYLLDCGEDIDKVWEKFSQKYFVAERECVPKTVVKIGKKRFSYSLDRKTLAARKRKYRLWKRYLSTKEARVYEDYCRCRNKVRRATRKAAIEQEKMIATKTKVNPKAFWKFVNSKTKMKSAIPALYKRTNLNGDKELVENVYEKATILGDHFSSVFKKEPDWNWNLRDENNPRSYKKVDLVVTRNIIYEKLQKLDIKKSPGPDEMHPRVFKELASVSTEPLYYLYSLSIKIVKVPNAWKLASVTAVYKNK